LERHWLDRDSSGLDLGNVQDIVQNAEQKLGRIANRFQIIAFGFIERAI
jgi:hypothetical protein